MLRRRGIDRRLEFGSLLARRRTASAVLGRVWSIRDINEASPLRETRPWRRYADGTNLKADDEHLVSGRAPAIFSAPKGPPHAQRDTN